MTQSRNPIDPREPLKLGEEHDFSLPKQVWNKYRYMTIYASIVSTALLLFQLRGK